MMWQGGRVLPTAVARSTMWKQSRNVRRFSARKQGRGVQVAKVGQFTDPAPKYAGGNFFLNGQLGYTGVIVHPFDVEVHEFDFGVCADVTPNSVAGAGAAASDAEHEVSRAGDEVQPTISTSKMYVALVNDADVTEDQIACNAFYPRVQALTRSEDEDGRPAVDFVLHEHIRPYTPASPSAQSGTPLAPFDNWYLDRFFMMMDLNENTRQLGAEGPGFDMGMLANPLPQRQAFLKQVQSQLDSAKLFTATTNGVRVTVMPFSMSSGPVRATHPAAAAKKNHWSYTVTVENLTDTTIKLVNRAWFTADGTQEADSDEVDGADGSKEPNRGSDTSYFSDHSRGVLGRSPILSPENRVFRFSSETSLANRQGASWGKFSFVQMNSEDKVIRQFSVNVPKFSYEMPAQVVTPGHLPPLTSDDVWDTASSTPPTKGPKTKAP